MPHRLDPPIQWAAAATAGKLVAQGVLEARDIVPQLLAAACRAGYRGDLIGLQARLTWQVNEPADHWRRLRDRTEWGFEGIRRAVAPLVEARALSADILRHAHAVNDQQGEPFLNREVWQLVRVILDEAMARLDRPARQRGRRNAR